VAGSLPVLKPREVAALLERLGFLEARQRGSHRQYRDADGRGTTVPFHGSRDISPTLLRKIARDIGLTVEELLGRRSTSARRSNSGIQPPAFGRG
jgi:predicted RNA binding protein YcfA (HicA-like mRNA interferase family)